MYIYNLPYQERSKLCRILDLNNAWEQLGGAYMKFDLTTLEHFRLAPSRNASPTDEMLKLWGTQNHTVLQLFILLSQMQHYQAMNILKPLVDEKYHQLIYEGEENFSRIFASPCRSNLRVFNHIPGKDKETSENEVNKNLNINLNMYNEAGNKSSQKDKACEKALIDFSDDRTNVSRRKSDEESKLTEVFSRSIDYRELEVATGYWDKRNLLGKGGFGAVFKGTWKNTQVAIKRLENLRGDGLDETCRTNRKQSLRELHCLNLFRHDNILPLYGYSIGGPHDCLVYQFMPKGSLEDRLLCRGGSEPLSWSQRHSIATGTARGLQYLHTISDKPLIHGDIKSANILLDPYFVPKIGDFGLAREGPLQQYTHVKLSRVHGTRPYLPDEFLRAKKFSTKVDTFSFGVVLFELITGLRAYDEYRTHKYLKDHVEATVGQNVNELRDSKGGYDEGGFFESLLLMGQWCVSAKPKDRPEMVQVLQKLDDPEKSGPMLVGGGGGLSRAVTTRKNSAPSPGPSPVPPALLHSFHSSEEESAPAPSLPPGPPHIVIEPPSSTPSSSHLPPSTTHVDMDDLPLISQLGIDEGDMFT